jgi:hypothetical protein
MKAASTPSLDELALQYMKTQPSLGQEIKKVLLRMYERIRLHLQREMHLVSLLMVLLHLHLLNYRFSLSLQRGLGVRKTTTRMIHHYCRQKRIEMNLFQHVHYNCCLSTFQQPIGHSRDHSLRRRRPRRFFHHRRIHQEHRRQLLKEDSKEYEV